jgi:hypothetical protein
MTFMTKLGAVAGTAVLVASLAGCAPSASLGEELVGTTWTGTDSRNHEWEIEFQEDRTIGFSYDGNDFDDNSDTWTIAADQLRIAIEFGDGTATMIGPYTAGATSVDLDGSQSGQSGSWTLTLTK